MNFIETWKDIRGIMDGAIANARVTPTIPAGRCPTTGSERSEIERGLRDGSSGWALYINYVDANGEESERRITCRRLEKSLGGALVVGAFCHEREAYRTFRVDRICEVIDLSTGEIMDPIEHFTLLATQGLPIVDRGIATYSKMLTFIMKCDGNTHPEEERALEVALTSYALRFDSRDEDIDLALRTYEDLAPDARDFTNCLGVLLRTNATTRRQVARLTIEHAARIIDADGIHAEEELYWGIEIGKALKKLAI